MIQKIFDPLAGSEKLDNGAIFYRVVDSELSKGLFDDEKLKEEFERLKNSNSAALEVAEDANDDLRLAIL